MLRRGGQCTRMHDKKVMDVQDEVLLDALSQGSHPAFEQLYDRYSRRIYANLIRLVRSEAVAEELLQDVFMKVWELRATINTGQSFRSFLFQISGNLAIDFYRKSARQHTMELAKKLTEESTYDHVEKYIDFKEAEILLDRAISALPPQRQRIFRLCRIEGKSYEEVAELFSLTRNTVKDHMTKANRFLRELLSQEYGPFLVLLAAVSSF